MLEVEGLTKYYGDLLAVDDVHFRIEEGEFVTLLGPSGCGKTTTLHMIAGLVEPTAGTVSLRGEDVTDVPPEDRNVGMAFQSTALFPHMTVRENIAYGLRMHGYEERERDERVEEFLSLVDLPNHGEHKPDELSGGQQQRVSLARALAYEPDILLLDEPLTGLDRVLREEMRGWLKSLQREIGVTSLYVTHDQEDALSMSDKVIVLDDGEKQQAATPRRLYEEPANPFVAEFVGKSTRFDGRVVNGDSGTAVDVGDEMLSIPSEYEEGRNVQLYVRPEDTSVAPVSDVGNSATRFQSADSKANADGGSTVATHNGLEGTVEKVANLGNRTEVSVALDIGPSATTNTTRFPDIEVGDRVCIRFAAEDLIVL